MVKADSIQSAHTLIIPAAGQSTRFPGRPKFLWTHPIGDPMFLMSTYGITSPPGPPEPFIVTVLEEHEKKYKFKSHIERLYSFRVHVIKKSKSQVDTVHQTIKDLSISGPIFIKDCDSMFNDELRGDNCICYTSLGESLINPGNKSYLRINEFNQVLSIVEKEVIGPYFSAGGYGFQDAQEFASICCNHPESQYISHIITNMIIFNDRSFRASECSQYVDWGTYQDWARYISEYSTYFVDIDGVLVESSSKYMEPRWGGTKGIQKNIDAINRKYNSGKGFIVLTTSRSRTEELRTIGQLLRLGIKYNDIIFNLPHCRRVLINDYSLTNPYPSATAINIERNRDQIQL